MDVSIDTYGRDNDPIGCDYDASKTRKNSIWGIRVIIFSVMGFTNGLFYC
mgnify:CR=1 FL=1